MSSYSSKKFHKLLIAGDIDKINATNWPSQFKKLCIYFTFNEPINGLKFPDSLEYLDFGIHFNHPLHSVKLPANLKCLIFSEAFNHPIDEIKLPDSIEYIKFGNCFNQSINTIYLPQSLKTLMIGFEFKQSFENVRWPSSLKNIIVPDLNNEILSYFPTTLEYIEAEFIEEPLHKLPPGLKKLIYGHDMHKSIKLSHIPLKCKVEDLSIDDDKLAELYLNASDKD